MIKLICPECRRENEPERIYCHDCGARLDRTALAKAAPKGEDAKETQRRLKSMLDPQRAKMRLMFFKVS
jgi:predicted amidophosphoribosyltransferase